MNEEFDWPRLTQYLCPRLGCGAKLEFIGLLSAEAKCPACGYRISETRLDEMVRDMQQKGRRYHGPKKEKTLDGMPRL